MNKNTPLFTWLALGQVGVIYLLIASYISLTFSLVDYLIKDPLVYQNSGGLNISMSIALVSTVLVIVLARSIGKLYKADSELISSSLRKWLGYLTMFVSGTVLTVDAIVVISNFFNGDTTASFIYKAIVLAILMVLVFIGFKREINKTDYSNNLSAKIIAWGLIVVSAALITATMLAFGGPQTQKDRRIDQQTAIDLSNIEYSLVSYYNVNAKLPADLSDIAGDYSTPVVGADGSSYTYKAIDEAKFELCANFKTNTKDDSIIKKEYAEPVYGGPSFNLHDSGNYCFTHSITDFIKPAPVR